MNHFISLLDCDQATLKQLIQRATELKQMRQRGQLHEPLKNRVLGMIFELSSTRTRVSFESAMVQLGGGALFLSPRDTQLGRGEPVEDTARAISGMVDCIMIRSTSHQTVMRFAEYSKAPVINALTDLSHPCQLLADIQTYTENRGDIEGKTVAWIGDGNNMCNSYIEAAKQFNFKLRVACPEGYEPSAEHLKLLPSDQLSIVRDPKIAAANADLVTTDVWASMGQEGEANARQVAFKDFMVDETLMALANPDAVFLHCLPAHRGEEVSSNVIDHPDSLVWQQAENRLHAQKALLEHLIAPQT